MRRGKEENMGVGFFLGKANNYCIIAWDGVSFSFFLLLCVMIFLFSFFRLSRATFERDNHQVLWGNILDLISFPSTSNNLEILEMIISHVLSSTLFLIKL